ncbi:MAG TPA: transposase [Candidatus Paceibacterota bacterium]|nr:transposase [Candidatus Paceibacterota bacterium]
MRPIVLAQGEYYHVFNRGVEKRDIFSDTDDLNRFLEGVRAFNSLNPIGSLFEHRFQKDVQLGSSTPKLVEVVCYCLNPNHFHLLLKQVSEKGIQKFMQKLGTGYTNYFNEKYKRSGGLFQGRYKAVHTESNEQLLHTSVYVNLNNQLGSSTPKLSVSSWEEYVGSDLSHTKPMCEKEIILGQFSDPKKYESFARDALAMIIERKQQEKDVQWLLGSLTPKLEGNAVK